MTDSQRARQETREERANDKLVQQAYDEKRLRILVDLDYRIEQLQIWIRDADEDTEDFWLRLRGRGIPDRNCELAAYQRLHAEIKAISSETSA